MGEGDGRGGGGETGEWGEEGSHDGKPQPCTHILSLTVKVTFSEPRKKNEKETERTNILSKCNQFPSLSSNNQARDRPSSFAMDPNSPFKAEPNAREGGSPARQVRSRGRGLGGRASCCIFLTTWPAGKGGTVTRFGGAPPVDLLGLFSLFLFSSLFVCVCGAGRLRPILLLSAFLEMV